MDENQNQGTDEQSQARAEELKEHLAQVLNQLPHDIEILLFSRKGERDLFAKAAEQVVEIFQKLSPKVKFKKYDLGDAMARKYEIDRSPTLLLGPDRYNIRWLGAPLGEEGRTFVEALILMGAGKAN